MIKQEVFPWYYIWSPKYEIFHKILSSNICDLSGFSVSAQFIPQSFFDKSLCKDASKHFFSGLTIKLNLLLHALRKHTDQYVLISDADLVVLRPELLYNYLQSYVEKGTDIVFMRESPENPSSNIGFGMVKSSAETIRFFEAMVEYINTEGGHDQTLYNEWIEKGYFRGTTDTFSIPEMLQSNNYEKEVVKLTPAAPTIMVQFLCSQTSYEANTVEKLFSAVMLVDISDLVSLISKDIFDNLKYLVQKRFPEHYFCTINYPSHINANICENVDQSSQEHTE